VSDFATFRRTILVVDDEPEIRALASAALDAAGHAVLEAADGPDAVKMFERHPEIDVVLVDVVLPGIDGFKVADMAKVRRPGVRIVYATGYPDRAHDHLGVVHGPILRKPYRPSELIDAIARALAAPATLLP
jgi:CheY-like chemotaxis protein